MPFAPHQRFCAKGRSHEIVKITTSSPNAVASSLKRRVCASHTPVSIEGTTLIKTVLPSKSDKCFYVKSVDNTVKSGALSPTLISGPTNVTGLLINVTCTISTPPLNNIT